MSIQQRLMTTEDAFPQIRITTMAHAHLNEIKEALRKSGQSRSMTDLASAAIMAIPIPKNGDGLTPCPECGALKVQGHSHE